MESRCRPLVGNGSSSQARADTRWNGPVRRLRPRAEAQAVLLQHLLRGLGPPGFQEVLQNCGMDFQGVGRHQPPTSAWVAENHPLRPISLLFWAQACPKRPIERDLTTSSSNFLEI